MHKVWHKPLHKRKAWRQMSFIRKTLYYMKPFLAQLLCVWWQPIPFPTLFKFMCSGFFLVIMCIPIIYVITVIICYYGIIQYFIESALSLQYPYNLDLIHYLDVVFKYQIENPNYVAIIQQYFDSWRYAAAVLASWIDYIRLALSLITG